MVGLLQHRHARCLNTAPSPCARRPGASRHRGDRLRWLQRRGADPTSWLGLQPGEPRGRHWVVEELCQEVEMLLFTSLRCVRSFVQIPSIASGNLCGCRSGDLCGCRVISSQTKVLPYMQHGLVGRRGTARCLHGFVRRLSAMDSPAIERWCCCGSIVSPAIERWCCCGSSVRGCCVFIIRGCCSCVGTVPVMERRSVCQVLRRGGILGGGESSSVGVAAIVFAGSDRAAEGVLST